MGTRLLPCSPVPSVISFLLSWESNFNGKDFIHRQPDASETSSVKYFNEKYVPDEIWMAC